MNFGNWNLIFHKYDRQIGKQIINKQIMWLKVHHTVWLQLDEGRH